MSVVTTYNQTKVFSAATEVEDRKEHGDEMNVGYARVSSKEQNLDLQRDALAAAGCNAERIFSDQLSGAKDDRPGLTRALAYIRRGDRLVVWRFDRLGRRLSHLIKVTTDLELRGIRFRSLQKGIDTTTSGGRLVFHIFGGLAELERSLIWERTQAGLEAAKTKGRYGGWPKSLTAQQLKVAKAMLETPKVTIGQVAEQFGVARTTLYRSLRQTQ